VPNALIAEYVVEEGTTLRDSLTRERIRATDDGVLKIPQEPGLGVTLNDDAVEKYAVKLFA
jgi:L-alanine-DL-glutamate epimerase-like enolase superfamily enzyme